MYSGSKRLLLAALVFAAFTTSAQAQAQIPIGMIEELIHDQVFNLVPEAEFHRVFLAYTRERYQGRTFLYQPEIQDFTASFVLYVTANGTIDAWTKKYAEQPAPARQPAPTRQPAPPPFPATHRLTADLKLFAGQDGASQVIVTLKKGNGVQVLGYGGYADMDGITAKWAQVKTEDGKTGWLFSGYLEDAK
ncbi:MAG: SH3 domain-containing protein [Treponema sp.]|jgi:hypothetical protein|nr:SH3 domain-containing protein [Treponema sp.]